MLGGVTQKRIRFFSSFRYWLFVASGQPLNKKRAILLSYNSCSNASPNSLNFSVKTIVILKSQGEFLAYIPTITKYI